MARASRFARRGAVALESAVVLPVVFGITLGLIAGGTGVFRYVQVAGLAREGARWAAARGGGYQRDTDLPSPTAQQIATQAVLPFAAGMDSTDVTVRVEWIDKATGAAADWDAAPKDVSTVDSNGAPVTNAVRVTVTCRLLSVVFGSGATCQSVCETPMTN